MLKRIFALLAIVIFATIGAPRDAKAVTLIEGTGWTQGIIGSLTDSVAYDFTLSSAGYFSLTDCCLVGDIYTIAGSFAGVSSFALAPVAVPLGLGDTAFDFPWQDITFSHFQIALAAGTYGIRVTGDCGGGCAAAFGVRVDVGAVPLPAAGFLLMGALGGMGLLSRRRGRKSV